MNLSTKERILEIANERRNGISAQKGPEYAGSAAKYADADKDVLANFKRQGDRWGTSPLLPTGVYFGKHIDSIETFVREATREGIDLKAQRDLAYKGEGILSRLDDARNYLDLMECLLVDLGILNDPRPEAYSPTPMLNELGPISGEDVARAVEIDGGAELAEDYNYMLERVAQLRAENGRLWTDMLGAKYAARMQAEARLEEIIKDEVDREVEALESLDTEPEAIIEFILEDDEPDEPDTWDALKDVVP